MTQDRTSFPVQNSGPLFEAVQASRIFPDSKTFPDSTARRDPEEIKAAFRTMLEKFVRQHFDLPVSITAATPPPAASMETHIDNLWPLLRRPADKPDHRSTLIPLPYPYVVPGGRFGEIYYWDSYFTCEGLAASGHLDLVESMIRNFAYLVEQVGHIPNGNRAYYLSRSQAPFFGNMLALLARYKGTNAILPYLPSLENEYRFWMDGQHHLAYKRSAVAEKRVVIVDGETLLNRYWDEQNQPRPEAFWQDSDLFQRAGANRNPDLYRDLRAAAESGWDFSSRWYGSENSLESTQATQIIPVDLNCLLYQVEVQLSEWLCLMNAPYADEYAAAAERRRAAIQRLCWNAGRGWFFDYSWRTGKQTDVWSLAGMYPLFCKAATNEQAGRVAEIVAAKFLQPGGVVTTLRETGQQWDWPNGWAPLQWIAIQGLRNYGHETLAREIATRFVNLAEKVYRSTGKMMEKYNVCDLDTPAGGGEYPNQDGFGWTNGVVKVLLHWLNG
jgi:alpha,alpha-trehalase